MLINLASRDQLVTQLGSLGLISSNSNKKFNSDQSNSNLLSQIEKGLAKEKSKIDKMLAQIYKFQTSGEQISEWHYLASLFFAQLSNAAVLNLSGNLDTHSNHINQHKQTQEANVG